MTNKSCLNTIKQKYDALTPVEKKIADYILAESRQVISMPISDFAENAGVVKSAIIRCCRTLGFGGYSEMKLALAMELSKNKQLGFVPYIDKNDNVPTILEKVFSANVKTLHDTAEELDIETLEKVVDAIDRARLVYIYGIGTSAVIASDFQYRLTQVGYTAVCFTDVPSMKVSTLNIKKGDLAFGVSNSGQTLATTDALSLAREMGATTACITGFPDSLITRICDLPLVISSDEIQYPIEAISSRIAQISVLDSIVISLSARHYSDAKKRAEKTKEFVDRGRYITKNND
ncbi:MAG: MurR/RpiR family transcriptional regulator [Clostridia bacterium]|nr:MurR/RpiR family transcriptional regulator [Clostridia bacterium]